MNQEDITRMAREAGFVGFDGSNAMLRKFAALVAAAERNKLAAWMMRQGYATGHGDSTEDLLKELEWQIAEREREECAKVCEALLSTVSTGDEYMDGVADCIAAIRARGNK